MESSFRSSEFKLGAVGRLVILGKTTDGKTFRPSDWAQRLAGVMSQFGPEGAACISPYCYSPWCTPSHHGSTPCVVLHTQLRDMFPQAWDFCVNFAKDNDLITIWKSAEAEYLPKFFDGSGVAAVRDFLSA